MQKINILSQFSNNASKVNPVMKSAEERANNLSIFKSIEQKAERRATVSLNQSPTKLIPSPTKISPTKPKARVFGSQSLASGRRFSVFPIKTAHPRLKKPEAEKQLLPMEVFLKSKHVKSPLVKDEETISKRFSNVIQARFLSRASNSFLNIENALVTDQTSMFDS